MSSLTKLFQNPKFPLKLFISSIHTSNQISHISNCKRIKANAKNHPQNGKNSFTWRPRINIPKSHRGQRLKGPIKTNQILLTRRRINDIIPDRPRIRLEIIKFGNQEPETTS